MTKILTPRRRTKIVATLGPATDDPVILEKTLLAGVDLVRLNFSHGKIADHQRRVQMVRDIAKKIGQEVAILADLQGPKIRIACFKQGKIFLKKNALFILDPNLDDHDGDEQQVGIDYKPLSNEVKANNILLLNDGRIVLKVNEIIQNKIHCTVIEGGELSDHKGINLEGGGLSAPALTDKDKQDIQMATQLGVDYIAISFVRNAKDVQEAKALLQQINGHAGIISKIERADALAHLDEIIHHSAAIMVARGDLGVEMGEAKLPGLQKRMIQRARALNKNVITATQMMESMIQNPIPTRAEVFDVANAVLDGTDAVMYLLRNATGQYPDKAVAAMARICLGAEQEKITQVSGHRLECHFHSASEAIAMATMYSANHLDVNAIIALTTSGSVPLLMSRIRSGIPIFALCKDPSARRRMALYRGVYPLDFDPDSYENAILYTKAIEVLKSQQIVHNGDTVAMTLGDRMGAVGSTNTMKILKVMD